MAVKTKRHGCFGVVISPHDVMKLGEALRAYPVCLKPLLRHRGQCLEMREPTQGALRLRSSEFTLTALAPSVSFDWIRVHYLCSSRHAIQTLNWRLPRVAQTIQHIGISDEGEGLPFR